MNLEGYRICLVVDRSGSMKYVPITTIVDIERYIAKLAAANSDREVELINFGKGRKVVSKFKFSDYDTHVQIVYKKSSMKNSTSLYGTLKWLISTITRKTAIVLVTDGLNNTGDVTLNELLGQITTAQCKGLLKLIILSTPLLHSKLKSVADDKCISLPNYTFIKDRNAIR